MSWQRLSRPAATFSCSTMALLTKPKRSCWPIILSPSSSRLTHPNSILLSGSGVTSKINWRVTCLPPWRNFLSRWLRLSLGIQPLTYARLQRSLTSSRLLSQLRYTNHKETVLQLDQPVGPDLSHFLKELGQFAQVRGIAQSRLAHQIAVRLPAVVKAAMAFLP